VGFAVDAIWELVSTTLLSVLASGLTSEAFASVAGTDEPVDGIPTGAAEATVVGVEPTAVVGAFRASFAAGCAADAVEFVS
jgi:hypothetical protein